MKLKLSSVLYRVLMIVTALAVLFVGFNVISRAKAFAVVTDSMTPTLKKGDVVFVRAASFESLQENDVVTVAFPDGSGYFTHRILAIDRAAGVIQTKGDANAQEDPHPSAAELIVGKVWYSVPLLGYLSILTGSMDLIKISSILAVVAIVIITAATLIQKSRNAERKDDSNAQS